MKAPVFLSASIPTRDPYLQSSDPIAIREAVLALVAVTVQERLLVFGGHPAISPLVEHAARSLNAVDNVYIFQSGWFANMITPEARSFKNFRLTPEGRDREDSLQIMRRQMIDFSPFCVGVFIGGMEGVEEECHMLKLLHPKALVLPVASTLGAALRLWDVGEGPQDPVIRDALRNDKHYRALFRRLLP